MTPDRAAAPEPSEQGDRGPARTSRTRPSASQLVVAPRIRYLGVRSRHDGARPAPTRLGSKSDPGRALVGRRRETDVLDQLLDSVRSGRSRVLVIRGDAGVGKSTMLECLVESASDCRVARAAGVESEVPLAYSGLHQLLAEVSEFRERLPGPQDHALATVFGLNDGPQPDPFLVGLATLTLFAIAAQQQPLVCIVDDAHWLDRMSAGVLGFVARRIGAARVAIVCAERAGVGEDVLPGCPDLSIRGLAEADSRSLLLRTLRAPLDPAVFDQIITDSHGNPLTLVALSRALNDAELTGGFGLPGALSVTRRIEQMYAGRLTDLPADAQLLVVAAAAEPSGDPALLQRAAGRLGLRIAAANPAVDAGLLEIGSRVTFADPLARSAAYRNAKADDRQRVHRAIAEVTDPDTAPDRRAWHRAHAALGPDERAAAALERSAGRARSRGGIAAQAAFLRRAVTLTAEPTRRVERALAAAQASVQAGSLRAAHDSLVVANTLPLDQLQRGRVEVLRGQLALLTGQGGDARLLLLQGARRLEHVDTQLAREAWLAVWAAANITGHLAGADLQRDIARSIKSLGSTDGDPRALDLLLDGLALLTSDGSGAAIATLRRGASALAELTVDETMRWGWLATDAICLPWDVEGTCAISARLVRILRGVGALGPLPVQLGHLGVAAARMGDFKTAESMITESDRMTTMTGAQTAPCIALALAAMRGNETDCSSLGAATNARANAGGHGAATIQAQWAAAVLSNGLGRYEEAMCAAQQASGSSATSMLTTSCGVWALPELVEASSRASEPDLARAAFARLQETTLPSGSDLALGIDARCEALLRAGGVAEKLYREALDRLTCTRAFPELARTHLVYGEWLRREGRRTEARQQLRASHEMLSDLDMRAFAERARRELLVTGGHPRRRAVDTRNQLTAQERRIARLARDGLTNPQIGTQLFISARTIEWHLRNVYAKLDITSRKELRSALGPD